MARADSQRVAGELEFPCFIKPACARLIGGRRHKVKISSGMAAALDDAFRYDRKLLVERAIPAREIECAVLGTDAPIASVPGEIVPNDEFYSYRANISTITA